MYLYDAVMIYAKALTEVINMGQDPRNGREVLKKIWNRTYHSVQGYDVGKINRIKNFNFSVCYGVGTWQPILNFSYSASFFSFWLKGNNNNNNN